jgi:plasmid maintenance system antidote protein VapI
MDLHSILRQYRITRPADLKRVLGVHSNTAWRIWQGKTKLTADMALRLHNALGIPVEQLLRAPVHPEPAPRGRPRKRRPPHHNS